MELAAELKDTLQSVRDLYNADKLLECARLLKPLRELVGAADANANGADGSEAAAGEGAPAGGGGGGDTAALKAALSTAEMQRIQKECGEVEAFKAALTDDDGWTLSYDGAETKVWYRREAHTSTHSLRIEGTIRAPLLNIAALLYESDLYKHLFWYVLESRVLQTPAHATLLRRATHILAFAPWPLHNRDVALYAYAVDALGGNDDAVLVVSRSIRDADGIAGVPEEGARGVVRAQFHNSGIEMRPVSPGETKARFLYNVDPQLGFLPAPLVNWGSRFMCRWSLRVLESRAKDLAAVSAEYAQRMESGPAYVRIRQRLKEYWEGKGQTWDEVAGTEEGPRVSAELGAKPTGPPKTLMMSLFRNKQA